MTSYSWGGPCHNCGHPASYHGATFCQVRAGAENKRECDCANYMSAALRPDPVPLRTDVSADPLVRFIAAYLYGVGAAKPDTWSEQLAPLVRDYFATHSNEETT